MRHVFALLSLMSLCNLGIAQEVLFDVFHNDSLELTAKNRYEEVLLSKLNQFEKLEFTYFTFKDSTLEHFRKNQMHPHFKDKWNNEATLEVIQSKAENRWKWLKAVSSLMEGYDELEYIHQIPKIRIDELSLVPISYLSQQLTFAEVVTFNFRDIDSEGEMDLIDFYVFDINTKEFKHLDDFISSIDHSILKEKVKLKWESLIENLPIDRMVYHRTFGSAPLIEDQKLDTNYIDLYSAISRFFSDASLSNMKYYWTGTNLMLRFPYALSELMSLYEFSLQIDLSANELQGIFNANHPYYSINDKSFGNTTLKNFSLYHFNNRVFTQNFERDHIDYIYVGNNIRKIEQSFQQYETSNVQVGKTLFFDANGQLTRSEYTSSNRYQVDSLKWEDDRVVYHLRREQGRDRYNGDYTVVADGFISGIERDQNDNVQSMVTLSDEIGIDEFIYMDSKLALLKYPVVSVNWEESFQLNWLTVRKNGWCDKYNCIYISPDGRKMKHGETRYLYNKKKQLIQSINPRAYSLFKYDSAGRIIQVEEYDNQSLRRSLKYAYKKNDIIPYLIEEKHPQDNEPRKHINKIYYR